MRYAGSEHLFAWNALFCVCFSINVCLWLLRPGDQGDETHEPYKSHIIQVCSHKFKVQSTSRCLVRKENKPDAIIANELALMLFYLFTRNAWGAVDVIQNQLKMIFYPFIIIVLANINDIHRYKSNRKQTYSSSYFDKRVSETHKHITDRNGFIMMCPYTDQEF